MFKKYYSAYGITGQKIKVECPPDSETTLLFVNRFRFSEKKLVDIFIHSDKTNSQKEIKEKLLTFNNDEKDTADINLVIKPKSIVYFSFQGQDCGVRLLFGTNSSQSIQFITPLMQSLPSNQISDFSKKIIVELEKAFHSDNSLLLMLLIFEKYFPNYFFIQREVEFPNLIQNVLQTSIKRLTENLIDNLFKYISFVSFKLSLGYQLTEASAIILISIIQNILNNDSSSNIKNEIINQCYDTPHFLVYQALFTYIKPNIIDQSLLLPVTFNSNKNIDAIITIYNYVISKKKTIHFTYLNLFSLIASESELKLAFSQNQLYDPEGLIFEKNNNFRKAFIDNTISEASIFEKKEVQTPAINFKPRKINQPSEPKKIETRSVTISYKPNLKFSNLSTFQAPLNEIDFTFSKNSSFSIIPNNKSSIQPLDEIKKSQPIKEPAKKSKQNKGNKNKKDIPQKQTKNSKQTKEIIPTNQMAPETTKKIVKSKRTRKASRNPLSIIAFTFIITTSIILLLCQYFFI